VGQVVKVWEQERKRGGAHIGLEAKRSGVRPDFANRLGKNSPGELARQKLPMMPGVWEKGLGGPGGSSKVGARDNSRTRRGWGGERVCVTLCKQLRARLLDGAWLLRFRCGRKRCRGKGVKGDRRRRLLRFMVGMGARTKAGAQEKRTSQYIHRAESQAHRGWRRRTTIWEEGGLFVGKGQKNQQ